MINVKERRHRERAWSIAPGPWSAQADGECATLEPPTRDTALQVSAYRKPAGEVTDADLADFAADAELPEVSPVQCGDFQGLSGAYTDDGVAWRKWWLRAGPLLLHVTYNGDEATAVRDAAAVDGILGTLRYEPDSPAG